MSTNSDAAREQDSSDGFQLFFEAFDVGGRFLARALEAFPTSLSHGRFADLTSHAWSLHWLQPSPTNAPLPVAVSSPFSHQLSHARLRRVKSPPPWLNR